MDYEQSDLEFRSEDPNDWGPRTIFSQQRGMLWALLDEIKRDVYQDQGEIKINMPLQLFSELAEEYRYFFRYAPNSVENIFYFPGPLLNVDNIQNYYKQMIRIGLFTSSAVPFKHQLHQLSELAVTNGRSAGDLVPIGNYIGLIEFRNLIRVVAQETDYSDDGRFWCMDTTVDEIGRIIRSASNWWLNKPVRLRPPKSRQQEQRIPRQTVSTAFDEDTSWIEEAQDFYDDLEADGYLDDL